MAAPEFVHRDHRLLGWGTTMSDMPSMVRMVRSLIELAPDTCTRLDCARLGERAYIRQISQHGTRDGGAFENVFLLVAELDEHARLRATDAYDVEQSDQALAHFEKVRGKAATQARFENAATRVVARATAAQETRDLERFGASFASDLRNYDRRALVQLETDR